MKDMSLVSQPPPSILATISKVKKRRTRGTGSDFEVPNKQSH